MIAKPTLRRGSLKTVFFLLVMLSTLVSACTAQTTEEEPTPTPLPTPLIPTKPTYEVQFGDVERKLEFTGRIVPVVQEELFFKSGGRVDKVLIKKSDVVEAGQLLAYLEGGTSDIDVRRAEIYLDMAKLGLEMTKMDTPKFLKEYPIIIKMKEYDVELAQLSLDEITARVDATQIKSTIAGTVLSVFLTEGSAIDAYKGVIVVADLSELEISAELADKEMQEITEGMVVEAWPVSSPGNVMQGTVRKLPFPYGRAVEGKQTDTEDNTTRLTLTDDPESFGMTLGDLLRVVVVLEKKENVLWLPPQAVRTFEGRKFVVVKEQDGQRRVDVKLGIASDDRVEIVEGLQEGQIVVAP